MNRLSLHQPARYRIVVDSHVDSGAAAWPPSFSLSHSYLPIGVPITTLEGILADQAALHGLLTRIRDLGLPLIAVNYLSIEEGSDTETQTSHKSNLIHSIVRGQQL